MVFTLFRVNWHSLVFSLFLHLESSLTTNDTPVYQTRISGCLNENVVEMVESATDESYINSQVIKRQKKNGIHKTGGLAALFETNKHVTPNEPNLEVAANIEAESYINSQVINQRKAKRNIKKHNVSDFPAAYETNLLGVGNKHGPILADNIMNCSNEIHHTYFNPGLQMSAQNVGQSDGNEFHRN